MVIFKFQTKQKWWENFSLLKLLFSIYVLSKDNSQSLNYTTETKKKLARMQLSFQNKNPTVSIQRICLTFILTRISMEPF